MFGGLNFFSFTVNCEIIGGLTKATSIRGITAIWKLSKETDLFELQTPKLSNGRAYHIALPISYDLAKQSCEDHVARRNLTYNDR